MHQEQRTLIELEFDDEPLDSFLKVMESLAVHSGRSKDGITLFSHYREQSVDRRRSVFALIHRIVADRLSNSLRLVDVARSNGAGVDFHECNEIRILCSDEFGDPLEVAPIAKYISGAGNRPMNGGSKTDAVSNVI